MDTLIANVIGDVALVLVVSGLLGSLARRCGQPTVAGQILAGILLGPTLLGHLPGHLIARLFPHAALSYLNNLAQISVVIFMFSVGHELNGSLRNGIGRVSLYVGASALLVPMMLGAGAVLVFRPEFRAVGQLRTTRSLILFMGVAMSVTALPVLAAIVRERGIAGTVGGAVATSAAGLMDAAAWSALAIVLAGTANGAQRPWSMTLGLFAAFIAVMLLVVRPAWRWWAGRRRGMPADQVPVALMLALGTAWVTTSLGMHPVFGGFLAGLTMPAADAGPDSEVLRRMEDIGGFLLPLFFVVTGLSVNMSALGGRAIVLLVLLCAIAGAGKLGPAFVASRLGGLTSREAATVAVLVNTRGLTELIALNAGLEAGIIGPRLFSILVLIALLMTVMTGPLLALLRAPVVQSPMRQITVTTGTQGPP